MIRPLIVGFFILFYSIASAQPSLTLVNQPITLANGKSFRLETPSTHKISIAWQGLQRPRFFAISPDDRVFLTDMYDRSDNKKGRVLILEGWNDSMRSFSKATVFLDSLHNPNQVAFHTVNGKHYIYVAETGRLSYYAYQPGSHKTGKPTVIATFPDYGLSYKYGGWHLTRSLAFRGNKLYVSVGSSCDACIETEEVRASIVEMNWDGSEQRIYARGLRNSVGIKWKGDELWVTSMGRDNRGPDKPEELLHTVRDSGFYGWPYYYQYRKTILTDTAFRKAARPAYVKSPPVAPWGFKAHSAPLGFTWVTGGDDPLLDNSFLVALHGSTSVWRQRGNAIVQTLPGGGYREIVTGFLDGKTENRRHGRPCDIIQWGKKGFLISDDKNGVIYFLERKR